MAPNQKDSRGHSAHQASGRNRQATVVVMPRKLDMLFAFKAIALHETLSATERKVAATLLDHFNQRTGQCDPGVNRLAVLVGRNPRTVKRALLTLRKLELLRSARHGGRGLRNQYIPNWPLFRELDNTWRLKMKARADKVTKPVVHGDTECHPSGGKAVTQTSLKNQSNQPVEGKSAGFNDKHRHVPERQRSLGKNSKDSQHLPGKSLKALTASTATVSSHEAAMTAAERRWWSDLHAAFAGLPDQLAAITGCIDEPLRNAATAAERNRRGDGLALIARTLSAAAATDTPKPEGDTP